MYIVFRTGSLAGTVGDWHLGGFESLTMLYFMAILEVCPKYLDPTYLESGNLGVLGTSYIALRTH